MRLGIREWDGTFYFTFIMISGWTYRYKLYLFEAMLTSSAVKLGGTDFEFSNIEYENYKGMESICKVFNGDGIIKSRVYKIDNDLFMISAGGQKIDLEMVDKFLNSFGLKK
mgnify:CR=1 FL=1